MRTIATLVFCVGIICSNGLPAQPTQETRDRWLAERIQRVNRGLTSMLKKKERWSQIDPKTEDEQEQIELEEWTAFGAEWEEQIRSSSHLKKYLELKRDGLLTEDASVELSHETKVQMTADIVRYFSEKHTWKRDESIFLRVPAPLHSDIRQLTTESDPPIRPIDEFVMNKGMKLDIGDAAPIQNGRVLFGVKRYRGPLSASWHQLIFVKEEGTWVLEVDALNMSA